MKNRFILFRREEIYYCEDRQDGLQKSLRTKNEGEARKLVRAKNEAINQPQMNLALAKAYLAASDPQYLTRSWADVFERFCARSHPATKMRHERVVRTAPMLFLRDRKLIETTAADFLRALQIGKPSTIPFLRTMHNDALGLGWILAPILPRKLWPSADKKLRRALTKEEHETFLAALQDNEWKLYLSLLWLTGASQTDAALGSVI